MGIFDFFCKKKREKAKLEMANNIVEVNGRKIVLMVESIRMAHKGQRWDRIVELPAVGRFVEESHYATTEDVFDDGKRLFPRDIGEGMAAHLARSKEMMNQWSPGISKKLEPHQFEWRRQWTPPEHGLAGQGARGNLKPTPIQELFQGNFMFADLFQMPPPGTKFLAWANGRYCVVSFGFEIGPPEEKYLGGFTPEVHWWLQTNDQSMISIGRLEDQSLPYGPLK